MLNFPKTHSDLVDNVRSLFDKGLTKLMIFYAERSESKSALEAIALYEHYQKINTNDEVATLDKFIQFLDKASTDYLKYFDKQQVDVFVYTDYPAKMNLKKMYEEIKKAHEKAVQEKGQKDFIEENKKLPVQLNIKEKTNKNTSNTSKSRQSKNGSENYQFGANVANEWLQVQIAKNIDSLENIRQVVSKDTLAKFLKSQSPLNDYLRGGMDQYDKIMDDLAPEVQKNNVRPSK